MTSWSVSLKRALRKACDRNWPASGVAVGKSQGKMTLLISAYQSVSDLKYSIMDLMRGARWRANVGRRSLSFVGSGRASGWRKDVYAPSGEGWRQDAVRLLSEARTRNILVVHLLPPNASPALAPKDDEALVQRPCESFSSDLERTLRRHGARSLILCGGPSSAALRASAVEGKSVGYKVAIAEDTVGDVSTSCTRSP